MSFLDPNRTFFNQSQWNFAQLLKMEKHKFWCILAEIDPLYDVIRGVKNPKNEFFGPNSDIFQPISKKFGKAVKNGKAQILVYFGQNWPPLWRHNGGGENVQKSPFSTLIVHFQPISMKLGKRVKKVKHIFWHFKLVLPNLQHQNLRSSHFFLTEIDHFSTNLDETWQKCLKCNLPDFSVFAWFQSFMMTKLSFFWPAYTQLLWCNNTLH